MSSASSSSFNAEFNSAHSGVETAAGADLSFGNNALAASSSSSFESANFGSDQQTNAGYSGVQTTEGVGVTSDFSSSYNASQGATVAEGYSGSFDVNQSASLGDNVSSSFESNSFGSQDGETGLSGAAFLNGSASGFTGFGVSSSGSNGDANDPSFNAFRAADLNNDGALDANEFRQFLSRQLRLQ